MSPLEPIANLKLLPTGSTNKICVIDGRLGQSPPKMFWMGLAFPNVFCGPFPRWICEITSTDLENIPSGDTRHLNERAYLPVLCPATSPARRPCTWTRPGRTRCPYRQCRSSSSSPLPSWWPARPTIVWNVKIALPQEQNSTMSLPSSPRQHHWLESIIYQLVSLFDSVGHHWFKKSYQLLINWSLITNKLKLQSSTCAQQAKEYRTEVLVLELHWLDGFPLPWSPLWSRARCRRSGPCRCGSSESSPRPDWAGPRARSRCWCSHKRPAARVGSSLSRTWERSESRS